MVIMVISQGYAHYIFKAFFSSSWSRVWLFTFCNIQLACKVINSSLFFKIKKNSLEMLFHSLLPPSHPTPSCAITIVQAILASVCISASKIFPQVHLENFFSCTEFPKMMFNRSLPCSITTLVFHLNSPWSSKLLWRGLISSGQT